MTVVGARTRRITPTVAILCLMALVALGPLLVGTAVATTLAYRYVSFQGEDGKIALLVAVITSSTVVFSLNKRGTPTSLTLALIGGIVGAGLGDGLPVQWQRRLSASGGAKYRGSRWPGSPPFRCLSVSEPPSARRGGWCIE
jgi:phosphate/sulfate permease